MGGSTERDWIPHAPGLRLKQVFLAKTQDEIGHAHLLYMVAADMGIKTRTEMLEDLFDGRSRFHNVFHYQAVTWADQIAIAFLVDAAAFASQRAVFAECTYGPYKRVLKRIVAEEGFHMRHGEEMLLRLATGTATPARDVPGGARPMVVAGGAAVRPRLAIRATPIHCCAGRSSPQRNEDLRHAYVQKYVPLLHGYGFEIPDDELHQDADGQWQTSTIDWEPLKATMRNGGPDSTTADRHRGRQLGRHRLGPGSPRSDGCRRMIARNDLLVDHDAPDHDAPDPIASVTRSCSFRGSVGRRSRVSGRVDRRSRTRRVHRGACGSEASEQRGERRTRWRGRQGRPDPDLLRLSGADDDRRRRAPGGRGGRRRRPLRRGVAAGAGVDHGPAVTDGHECALATTTRSSLRRKRRRPALPGVRQRRRRRCRAWRDPPAAARSRGARRAATPSRSCGEGATRSSSRSPDATSSATPVHSKRRTPRWR